MNRYYDLVLALIPLALLGIGGALVAAGVGLQLAVSASGLAAVGLISHALFVNGPVDGTPGVDARRTNDATGVSTGPVNAD